MLFTANIAPRSGNWMFPVRQFPCFKVGFLEMAITFSLFGQLFQSKKHHISYFVPGDLQHRKEVPMS
jgi:hypothetical protein